MIKMADLIKKQNDMIRKESGMNVKEEKLNEIDFSKIKLPSVVDRFLNKFVDAMKGANLNRLKRSAILYKVINASGMSVQQLMADIQKIKKELNEWNDTTFKGMPKRWSNSKGLTEFEQQGGKDFIKEGPAGDYEPYIHAIDQNYKKYWDSVKDFQKVLDKKGLKGVSKGMGNAYINLVVKFHKLFGKIVRKLL